ncbi:hypothetical protein PZA11_000184 [Diplocarpon coronariae]
MCSDIIIRRAQQLNTVTYQSNTPMLQHENNNTSPERVSNILAAELVNYKKAIGDWFLAFKPLFDSSRSRVGSNDYLGANVLMARYIPGQFLFNQNDETDEIYTDAYLKDYTLAVNLIQDVLENYPISTPGEVPFTFENTFVQVLFIIALQCRDFNVRRRSIFLLVRYPRREGLWDSVVCSKVAIWVVNREEEGMVNGSVPESARLRIEKDGFEMISERKAVIRFSKLVPDLFINLFYIWPIIF